MDYTKPKHGTLRLNTQIYVEISILEFMDDCLCANFPLYGVEGKVVNLKHFCKYVDM